MFSKPITLNLIFCWILLFQLRGVAQESTILNTYIKEGLANNATLKTQQFDVEKAVKALEQAQTLFKPQVSFQMQYTLAAGGRTQALPIGDLLNEAYSTLNQLTQTNNFPQVENQNINFLPNHFHDTKIRTMYPILNKEIVYNREIKKELITVEQAKINVYKRELVKNIKMAYIQYLQAVHVVDIYKNALGLVHENLRVNQKLVKNDIATRTVVLKAESEVSKIENSIVEAENNVKNAAAYFNFLLNKTLNTPIERDNNMVKMTGMTPPQLTNDFEVKREEFQQIKGGQRANSLVLKMNEAYKTPKIGAALDLGFQGFGFKLWDKQAYGLLGLQMEVPLYSAGANKLKIEQTQLDLKKLSAQNDEVLKQIQLQIQIAQTNLETAQRALKVNDAEVVSAREYYRLMERRYREGQALQIELTDARTQLTAAELKQTLAQYAVLLRGVELERATGSYEIRN
jgi:outer membrane protein TolC